MRKIKILESDGRQDIFLGEAGKRQLKLIKERLNGILPSLTLDRERDIRISGLMRMPDNQSFFFVISSDSESGEFDPRLTQMIREIINGVLISRKEGDGQSNGLLARGDQHLCNPT